LKEFVGIVHIAEDGRMTDIVIVSNPERMNASNAMQIHSKDRTPYTAEVRGNGLTSMGNTSFANVLFMVLAASTLVLNSLGRSPSLGGVTKAASDVVTGLRNGNH